MIEDKKNDEELEELDLNDRILDEQLITEEESAKILITRNRLTAWFGA